MDCEILGLKTLSISMIVIITISTIIASYNDLQSFGRIRRMAPPSVQWTRRQQYSDSVDQKLASLAEKNLPDGILRKTKEGEIVGPGADKNGVYKNTEYYTTHKWSFIELNLFMSKFRSVQPDPKKTKSKYQY